MHRPRAIRRFESRMVEVLSFQRRVAAADYGLAEIPEAVVYVLVALFLFGFWLVWRGLMAVPALAVPALGWMGIMVMVGGGGC